MMAELSTLWPVYLAYLLGTLSPGPSNLAIISVAMRQGRRPALALAAGVVSGSLCWAILAACGISTLLLAWSKALIAIKFIGAGYLLWLAGKAARSAAQKGAGSLTENTVNEASLATLWRRGVLLHLANPKAVLVWLAILSLGMHPHAPVTTLPLIIGGCALLGAGVFGGYALLFSTTTAARVYLKARRPLEGTFALFFGAAGVSMLIKK